MQWTRRQHSQAYTLRARQALESGKWHGFSEDIADFVHDTYAIDFLEQGGALHGNFLHAQSKYVAQVIMTLVVRDTNNNYILYFLCLTISQSIHVD